MTDVNGRDRASRRMDAVIKIKKNADASNKKNDSWRLIHSPETMEFITLYYICWTHDGNSIPI